MRVSVYPWSLRSLLQGRATLGGLMALCEENYQVLARLIPEMPDLAGYLCSGSPQGMDLHLEILEQTPYTTLLHLTYYFYHDKDAVPDPDATLRVYHDAGQVEVLDLRQTALPLVKGPHYPTLEQKWKANLFLSKWLAFSVAQGHLFKQPASLVSTSCHTSLIASA